jgi:hypothetical protein
MGGGDRGGTRRRRQIPRRAAAGAGDAVRCIADVGHSVAEDGPRGNSGCARVGDLPGHHTWHRARSHYVRGSVRRAVQALSKAGVLMLGAMSLSAPSSGLTSSQSSAFFVEEFSPHAEPYSQTTKRETSWPMKMPPNFMQRSSGKEALSGSVRL